MGYRSTVVCRIVGEHKPLMAELARLAMKYGALAVFQEAMSECTTNNFGSGRAIFGFTFDDIKWYDSYPDIEMFEMFWDHFCTCEKHGFDGAFLRIGEEDQDTELRYFGDDPYELISYRRTYDAVNLNPAEDLRSALESADISQQGPQDDSVVEP